MTTDTAQLSRVVESSFGRPNVLVVGDVMLDKYVWGDVDRISPEAPVPVLRTTRQSQQAGGAANVAMNLSGLGARTTLVGIGGDDDDQRALDKLLLEGGITVSMVARPGSPTTTKLRILAGHQQMLRLDNDPPASECSEASERLLRHAMRALPEASVIVLSDYAKGALNQRICRALIGEARRLQIPVVVDPKGNDFARYRGATIICPNAKELAAVTGEPSHELKWLLSAGQKMVAALDLKCMLVTLGERGIAILRQDSITHVPAAARQVFDVSGAGDTVVALVALSTAARIPIEMAAELANRAAGVVISKVGTVPVQRNELLGMLAEGGVIQPVDKVLSLESLLARVTAWRSQGQSIVFTNGCFDLLHAGHVSLMEQARRMGDRLIVAVNSDRSVRYLKGRRRPLVAERERAQVVAALAAVDAVVVFDETTPLRLIESLRPDVLVKGGDYTQHDVVGAAEVRSWGGRIELVPIVSGCSTTGIIERSDESRSIGARR